MAIYKNRWFDRWARKEGLTTASLCTAVQEMAAGLFEADLGGGLVKKRIARAGQGRARVAAFARWSPPTRAAAGSSFLASRKMSAATSTRTKNRP